MFRARNVAQISIFSKILAGTGKKGELFAFFSRDFKPGGIQGRSGFIEVKAFAGGLEALFDNICIAAMIFKTVMKTRVVIASPLHGSDVMQNPLGAVGKIFFKPFPEQGFNL